MVAYLEHTLSILDDSALFIITVRPYEKASKDGISRWRKLTKCQKQELILGFLLLIAVDKYLKSEALREI